MLRRLSLGAAVAGPATTSAWRGCASSSGPAAPNPAGSGATPPSSNPATPAADNSVANNGSGTQAGAPPPPPGTPQPGPSLRAKLLGCDVPYGFESAYAFPFQRPGGQPISQAILLSDEERFILNRIEKEEGKMRMRRRIILWNTIMFGGMLYFFGTVRIRHWFNTVLGADAADGSPLQNSGIISSIWVSLEKHVAHYYGEGDLYVTSTNFIDFDSFEGQTKSDPKTSSTPLFLSVPVYYPWVPMALLLLIPFMAFFHDSLTIANRAATKAAAAIGKGEKRFKFQTDRLVKTKLNDVAGLTEAKNEIVEIIDFMKQPQRYTSIGARLPKGVLLDGPPGVGKTLIAKAVAGEAMVPMVSCSGSEFDEVFVGVGAARVRELFKEARKNAPCVVFIDEIDAFGKKRQSDGRGGSRGTLNALLSELDGFKDSAGIIVLAATNRADVLDPALTRSGRFDRKISLEKPPHKDRVEIAKVHLKPLLLEPSLDLVSAAEQLASLTPGCSGADIYNICNEAAIIASREGRENVNMACFHKALERVLIGMTKASKKFSEEEKKRLAYHEAGHVVLQWVQSMTDPVVKASIVPRGGDKAGITQKLPTDKYIITQEELHQRMICRLGGYVSEELFFTDLSTSASDDLRTVTEMAMNEITTYGMEPQGVGHVHYETSDSAIAKPFGPTKENEIDNAVETLVSQALKDARQLLRSNIEKVRVVGGLLYKYETLTAHELWRVLGERPVMSQDFRRFLESRH